MLCLHVVRLRKVQNGQRQHVVFILAPRNGCGTTSTGYAAVRFPWRSGANLPTSATRNCTRMNFAKTLKNFFREITNLQIKRYWILKFIWTFKWDSYWMNISLWQVSPRVSPSDAWIGQDTDLRVSRFFNIVRHRCSPGTTQRQQTFACGCGQFPAFISGLCRLESGSGLMIMRLQVWAWPRKVQLVVAHFDLFHWIFTRRAWSTCGSKIFGSSGHSGRCGSGSSSPPRELVINILHFAIVFEIL